MLKNHVGERKHLEQEHAVLRRQRDTLEGDFQYEASEFRAGGKVGAVAG
jgi:hypothetical protein